VSASVVRAVVLSVGLLAVACGDAAPPVTDEGTGGTATASAGSTGAGPTTGEPRERAPLVDHARWAVVDAADDPLADHRPAEVDCGSTGAFSEGRAYEIDTGLCNYLARSQPSLVEIRAGDRLFVAAFHDTLAATEAGQAHFALLVGGTVVWERFVDIPASPAIVEATPFQDELLIDVDVPAGTPVDLHLHNHGYNTWTLLDVEVRPAEAP
jgi:hypothetical protein